MGHSDIRDSLFEEDPTTFLHASRIALSKEASDCQYDLSRNTLTSDSRKSLNVYVYPDPVCYSQT